MLDKESIRANADLMVVAEELGVEVYRRGSKNLIYCPCHDDKHLGSCFINEKKFYCYSCHAEGDVFLFTQKILNIGFPQALRVVAEICGGADLYELPEGEELRQYDALHFISKKNQQLIGLYNTPVYTYVGTTVDYEEADMLRSEGFIVQEEVDSEENFLCYSIQKKTESSPLYRLYKEDRDTYRALIDDFCQRTIDRYHQCLSLLHHPELAKEEHRPAIQSIRNLFSDMELAVTFAGFIKEVQDISLAYGTGAAVRYALKTEDVSVAIPRPSNLGILTVAADSILKKEEAPF